MSMRKIYSFLFLSIVAIQFNSFAQKNGSSTGVWGSYGVSSFMNNDDANFKPLLKLNTTLKFNGGFEKVSFWGNHFGHGIQLGYSNIGQNYTIIDTLNKLTTDIKTSIQAVKTSVLFYYRSYNRYYPNRVIRFNSHFGPYFALHPLFTEKITVTSDVTQKIVSEGEFTPLGYRNATAAVADFDLTKPIYNLYSYGFTFSPGMEVSLGNKTTLFFNIRTDISSSNIENRENIFRKQVTGPDLPFSYWDNLIAKGFLTNGAINEFNRRPDTKVFFGGAVLGFRFYTKSQKGE
jgi:hypothetical protein